MELDRLMAMQIGTVRLLEDDQGTMIRVPGGWIYRAVLWEDRGEGAADAQDSTTVPAVACSFVPEPTALQARAATGMWNWRQVSLYARSQKKDSEFSSDRDVLMYLERLVQRDVIGAEAQDEIQGVAPSLEELERRIEEGRSE